ncbi:phosphate import ATP-binding protein PstB [Campylobacterota bacterium]|nr:phosphate import ATP-binding protein PstB [Campylobacterota bacterium]
MIAVRFSDFSLSFGNAAVLRSVNAEFGAHKISVITGRSGAGKTALLRAINRLNEEFDGAKSSGKVEVSLGGVLHSAADLPLVRLRSSVGMLFQTPALFPMSIFDNIALPLSRVLGAPKSEIAGRVESALHRVGLLAETAHRLRSKAENLSGGQQQRLSLARLLALEPQILLLDEPTASLDIHATAQIEELLKELSNTITIIMVSHNLDQASRLANAQFICEDGKIALKK